MATTYRCVLLLSVLTGSAGCMVTQDQTTPVLARRVTEPTTGREYWLYVPSDYAPGRPWPLVVTLHGSGLWDSSEDQIREWKHLAEKRGLIVAAPDLASASFSRLSRSSWQKDLESDERAVLAVIDQIVSTYSIGVVSGTRPSDVPPGTRVRRHILLTGFLEGGYALYYIGLRHAGRFGMLMARDCYSDAEMLENIAISDEARATPMLIGSGKDGWWTISGCVWNLGHAWEAYRFLRVNRCYRVERKEYRGGQLRRPDRAYRHWARFLPAGLRR